MRYEKLMAALGFPGMKTYSNAPTEVLSMELIDQVSGGSAGGGQTARDCYPCGPKCTFCRGPIVTLPPEPAN